MEPKEMGVIAGCETPTGNMVPSGMLPGLAVLLQAHQYAAELACSMWDFAVEIQELRAEGLTKNDLRWLVCKDYVEHRREISIACDDTREFRKSAPLAFSKRLFLYAVRSTPLPDVHRDGPPMLSRHRRGARVGLTRG